jgi:hypothetical protein
MTLYIVLLTMLGGAEVIAGSPDVRPLRRLVAEADRILIGEVVGVKVGGATNASHTLLSVKVKVLEAIYPVGEKQFVELHFDGVNKGATDKIGGQAGNYDEWVAEVNTNKLLMFLKKNQEGQYEPLVESSSAYSIFHLSSRNSTLEDLQLMRQICEQESEVRAKGEQPLSEAELAHCETWIETHAMISNLFEKDGSTRKAGVAQLRAYAARVKASFGF